MSKRMTRWTGVAALAGLLVAGAACDPGAPDPVALAVNTTADLHDLVPGDGVCEATAGAGDCSLRAAIEEASVLGAVDLTVPADTYAISGSLQVDARVNLNVGAPATVVISGDVEVTTSGFLGADGLEVMGTVLVDGTLVLRRGTVAWGGGTPLVITESGAALIQHSTVIAFGTSIVNEGVLLLQYATVGVSVPGQGASGTSVDTGAGGATVVEASFLNTTGPAPACVGVVTSTGYNAATDDTCGLDAVGDLEGVPVLETGDFDDLSPEGTALVDAIPAGAAGCGTTYTFDRDDRPRPMDATFSGVPACDIGAFEVFPPVPL